MPISDVLSGKADKVDPSLIEHSTKRKRRRANRINLIGEKEKDLTKRDQIGVIDDTKDSDQVDILTTVEIKVEGVEGSNQEVEVANLLCSTPSPLPASTPDSAKKSSEKQEDSLFDLAEFEVLDKDTSGAHLTSNVAILAGEFSKPVEEEEDDFDAAFDALAQESYAKGKLEDLEKEFENEDVFDTQIADTVLNLASLTKKVEVIEEFDDFEDKDPFDTSAYEHITGDLEADWDFDSLAKRGPENDCPELRTLKQESDNIDDAFSEFSGWSNDKAVKPAQDQGWSAFEESKPKRPPPPKPPPPRPSRPPARSKNTLDPKNTPSVVVKAPSTESIKSWNCSTAENLIKKSRRPSEIDGEPLEALEEDDDPFDTSHLDAVIAKEEEDDPFDTSGFKSPEPEKEEEEELPEPEDPFDLSHCRTPEPKYQEDLLTSLDDNDGIAGDAGTLIAPTAAVADPFDTEFASQVLPDKGDPFDTDHVKGGPGKAEIKALEEELDIFDEGTIFDPRLEEGTKAPSKRVAAGIHITKHLHLHLTLSFTIL